MESDLNLMNDYKENVIFSITWTSELCTVGPGTCIW